MNFSLYIDIGLTYFHILVLQEYWVLIESRIPFKLKEAMRAVVYSRTFH